MVSIIPQGECVDLLVSRSWRMTSLHRPYPSKFCSSIQRTQNLVIALHTPAVSIRFKTSALFLNKLQNLKKSFKVEEQRVTSSFNAVEHNYNYHSNLIQIETHFKVYTFNQRQSRTTPQTASFQSIHILVFLFCLSRRDSTAQQLNVVSVVRAWMLGPCTGRVKYGTVMVCRS